MTRSQSSWRTQPTRRGEHAVLSDGPRRVRLGWLTCAMGFSVDWPSGDPWAAAWSLQTSTRCTIFTPGKRLLRRRVNRAPPTGPLTVTGSKKSDALPSASIRQLSAEVVSRVCDGEGKHRSRQIRPTAWPTWTAQELPTGWAISRLVAIDEGLGCHLCSGRQRSQRW